MQPLVSILIPAYNSERWIKETLQSALNQTCARKEIIVVDDGSCDNTLKIARMFESGEVKVASQPNSGASSARNHALAMAQGDFIQWLDSDDVLHPEKIDRQMARFFLENNDNKLFSSGFGTFYYRTYKAIFSPNSLWRDLDPLNWFIKRFYFDSSMFPAVWLVSRNLTEKVGLWDERLSLDDDGEYFARLISVCESVCFVPGAKSFYRQANTNSISKTITHKACTSLLLSYKLCIGYMLSLENSERTRSAALQYLQANLIYFYPEEKALVKELMTFAGQLGGELSQPVISEKYRIISSLLGVRAAKQIASTVRGAKQCTLKNVDKLMAILESTKTLFEKF